jgi:ATP synthase I subunit
MAEPDSFYFAAEKRIERLTLVLGMGGGAFAFARWGWRFGAGVSLGAALTWLNFRWLKQGVGALVRVSTAQRDSEHARVPRSVYFKFFGRFALLLGVVYVILSRSILPVVAVLGGLFAIVAAVMIEMVWQLVHGRDRTGTHT